MKNGNGNLYCVVYRVGGRESFEWRRSLGMSKDEAVAAAAEVERGGRRALVEKLAASLAVGLPESFDVASFNRDPGEFKVRMNKVRLRSSGVNAATTALCPSSLA